MGEVVYHSPESTNNDVLKLLLDTGKLTPEDLALMLIRKHDWHHYEGAKLLLEYGADPNLQWNRGNSPFYHSVLRDNDLEFFELLLDYAGDPTLMFNGNLFFLLLHAVVAAMRWKPLEPVGLSLN